MSKISNKKRKFIKRNFKDLSIEELARQTGLKPHAIRSLIDEYTVGITRKEHHPLNKLLNDKSSHKKRFIQVVGIGAIFIFALTFVVYTPALKNEFVNRDDGKYVYENYNIQYLNTQSLYWMFTSFHASNWHPLTWLSHAIDYAFWGLNPSGHHLTNIILHGLNTVLVFLLVIQLMLRAKEVNKTPSPSKASLSFSAQVLIVASVTALLFGLHPLHVESVAWVAERKDLLCSLFFILTILSYLSYTSSLVNRHRWIWFYVCLLLFIFALMSKPMAVTLPVTLLLLDVYPLKRINLYSGETGKKLSVLLEKIPFFALSLVSSIITIIAQHSGGAVKNLERLPFAYRLLNAPKALIFYVQKMLLPIDLIPFYPLPESIYLFDIQYIMSGIIILTITGFCLWMVKLRKYLFFTTWSYYVITLAPVLGIIQVGDQAAADRYTYLPSLSIFLLIGIGVSWFFERIALTRYRGILSGLLLAHFFIVMVLVCRVTIRQIKIWQSPESLWSYVINASSEKNPIAHNGLGIAYYEKGMLDEAIMEYKKSLSMNPDYADVHLNLGNAYYGKGELDKAVFEYQRVITINPHYAKAHYNIGVVYYTKGELDNAISEYNQALAINPRYADAHINLGVVYYYKGNYKLALFHCNKAIELGGFVNPKLLTLLKPYR